MSELSFLGELSFILNATTNPSSSHTGTFTVLPDMLSANQSDTTSPKISVPLKQNFDPIILTVLSI